MSPPTIAMVHELVRRLVVTIALSSAGLASAAAQPVRAPTALPTLSGPRVLASRTLTLRPGPVGTQRDPETLARRRRQFAGVGAVLGGIAGGIWAVRSVRDDGLARALSVLVLPIPVLGGAVIGAVAGYGLGVVIYPPPRAG